MSSVVPEGWNIRLAENLFVREKVKVTHDRNSVSKRGSYPVIDQSEDGEIGFVDVLPEFDCSPQNPIVTFANHTCAVRKMTTPFGVIQNVFPLSSQVDSDVNFVYQALLSAIEPEGYKGHYPKLRETEFLTPPLPEQKKIASILTSVDEVIESTQKQIDKLQDLKKATMNELLTKGIGHTEYKDSELGRIPKNWEVSSLGECFSLTSGKSKPKRLLSSVKTQLSKVPVYGGNGVTGYTDSELLDEKTIVIGRVGEYCGCVHLTPKLCWITDNALYIKSITRVFDLSFMFHLMVFSNLAQLHSKGGQPLVSQKPISEFLIALPPIVEQQKIASFIDAISSNINNQSVKLSQTQSLKKSLMQDLLTGKVRVTVN
jgi:restriction endonuclease S subunit